MVSGDLSVVSCALSAGRGQLLIISGQTWVGGAHAFDLELAGCDVSGVQLPNQVTISALYCAGIASSPVPRAADSMIRSLQGRPGGPADLLRSRIGLSQMRVATRPIRLAQSVTSQRNYAVFVIIDQPVTCVL